MFPRISSSKAKLGGFRFAILVLILTIHRIGGEEFIKGPVVGEASDIAANVEFCSHLHGDEFVGMGIGMRWLQQDGCTE